MNIIQKVKKNFYWGCIAFFLIWILFFDPNDIISQFNNYQAYKKLTDSKVYYQEKIVDIQKDLKSLRSNSKELEKFAREEYLMKKENEEIFIIEMEEE